MSKKDIYEFRISLDKNVYRIVAAQGNLSLYLFAETIVKSFGFDLDHAFGFYNNIKSMYESTEAYELFADNDDGDSYSFENAKGVSNICISEVFIEKKKMLFIFDYGDHWEFIIECKKITESNPKIKYPKILEKEGRAPKQYSAFK